MLKKNTIGFLILIVLLAVSAVVSLNLLVKQRNAIDQLDINSLPLQIGDWQGKDLPMEEESYRILETRNIVLREYKNREGKKINLYIAYSETNRSVFHPPEVCMMGSGVAIVDKDIAYVDIGNKKIKVNKIYTAKDNYRGLALYCYKTGSTYTEDFYRQQIYFSLGQLLGKQKGGAMIRVSCALSNDEEGDAKTLEVFFKEVANAIDLLSPSK